jgi:hypothetical protein
MERRCRKDESQREIIYLIGRLAYSVKQSQKDLWCCVDDVYGPERKLQMWYQIACFTGLWMPIFCCIIPILDIYPKSKSGFVFDYDLLFWHLNA